MSPRPMRRAENQAEPIAKWDLTPTIFKNRALLPKGSTTTLETPVPLSRDPSIQLVATSTLQARSSSLNSTQRAWVSLGSIVGGVAVVVLVWCCCCRTPKSRRRRSKRSFTTLSTTESSSAGDEIPYRGGSPFVVYPNRPYPDRPPPVVIHSPRRYFPNPPPVREENQPQSPQNNSSNQARAPASTSSASSRNTEVGANGDEDTPAAGGHAQPAQNGADDGDDDTTSSISATSNSVSGTPANHKPDQSESNSNSEDSKVSSRNGGKNTDRGDLETGEDTDGDNEGSGSEDSDGRRSARSTRSIDERDRIENPPSRPGGLGNPRVVIVSPAGGPNTATQGINEPNIAQADLAGRQQPDIRLPRQYGQEPNPRGLDLPRDYNQQPGNREGRYPQNYIYGQPPGLPRQYGQGSNTQGLNVPRYHNELPGQNAGQYYQGYGHGQQPQAQYPAGFDQDPRYQGDIYSPPHSIVGGPTQSVHTGRRQRPQSNHPEIVAFLTGSRKMRRSVDR